MGGRIAIIGEPLLELSHPGAEVFGPAQFGFAGDTLNTAVYLSRLGTEVDYVTALGLDPYSEALLAAMRAEGVGTELILRHPSRVPGLYAIQTDASGERSFTYWRSESAAREFFDIAGGEQALDAARACDALYLSGISLSLFDAAGRQKLAILADEMRRAGKPVVFDPNYRARGWPTPEAARQAFAGFARHASLALPTLDDDVALFGAQPMASHAAYWQGLGVETVVVKCGADGAHIFQRGEAAEHVPVPRPVVPRDTTGAGDSFNAAFLHRWLSGADLPEAVLAGHELAGRVVQHPGAILPLSGMPAVTITREATQP